MSISKCDFLRKLCICLTFIKSKNYPTELDQVKQMCMDDFRILNNPLMRRLYEMEIYQESGTNNVDIVNSSQLWRYRQPLSISHMRTKLQEKFTQSQGQKNRQLQKFLHEVS